MKNAFIFVNLFWETFIYIHNAIHLFSPFIFPYLPSTPTKSNCSFHKFMTVHLSYDLLPLIRAICVNRAVDSDFPSHWIYPQEIVQQWESGPPESLFHPFFVVNGLIFGQVQCNNLPNFMIVIAMYCWEDGIWESFLPLFQLL